MAIAETGTSNRIQMDYMKLLVIQMQNQNPLEPMSNQEMAAQLAQFSQLERMEDMSTNIQEMNLTMEKLNSSFQGSLLMAEYDYAKSLLGKKVSFYSNDYSTELEGGVEKVKIDPQTGYSYLDVKVDGFTNSKGDTVSETIEIQLGNILGISDML